MIDKLAKPSSVESVTKRPVYLKEKRQAAHCYLESRKAKIDGTNAPCKNKHLKG